MVRARLPFTKKFQPKFSVFSCANTHSATKTPNSLDREMREAFALRNVCNQSIDIYDMKRGCIFLKLIRNDR